jgi:hypothetical protein
MKAEDLSHVDKLVADGLRGKFLFEEGMMGLETPKSQVVVCELRGCPLRRGDGRCSAPLLMVDLSSRCTIGREARALRRKFRREWRAELARAADARDRRLPGVEGHSKGSDATGVEEKP